MTMADPLPAEPQAASLALCDDVATGEAVRTLYDAEHGLPVHCLCADGSEPQPGVPCTLLHCLELEPIGDGRVAHPFPIKPLPAEVAAKCESKTREEVDEFKREHAEPEPIDDGDLAKPIASVDPVPVTTSNG